MDIRKTSLVAKGLVLAALSSSLFLSACAVPVTQTDWVQSAPVERGGHVSRYGTVEDIVAQDTHLEPSGGGAVVGTLVGGVIGSRFGAGFGRAIATGVGAVGGAVLGNTIERNEARASGGTEVYHVTVRMDDGERRSVDFHDLAGLRVGDRVHFRDGELIRG